MQTRQTIADQVREKLIEDIVKLRLKPNEKLSEQFLAGRFGTSRAPVHDALAQLEPMGLVHIVPQSGIVTALHASAGSEVVKDQSAATIATSVSLRAEVSADDAARFKKGDTWYYTRNDDPHETHFTCTVQRVLTNEADASATVVLIPEEKDLPIGLGIILTDEEN